MAKKGNPNEGMFIAESGNQRITGTVTHLEVSVEHHANQAIVSGSDDIDPRRLASIDGVVDSVGSAEGTARPTDPPDCPACNASIGQFDFARGECSRCASEFRPQLVMTETASQWSVECRECDYSTLIFDVENLDVRCVKCGSQMDIAAINPNNE